MEYGVRLLEPGPLPRDPRGWCGPALGALLPPGLLRAVYFGSEFCEDRLPSCDEAASFCAYAESSGLEAVLLTPPVSPRGLSRVTALLSDLRARALELTVTFNDWGVLQLLERTHPALPRRGGRLLNRALRDPRLAEPEPAARQPGVRGTRLRRFLRERGAVGLETDPDLEGGYLGGGDEGLQRTLHLPYTFATTGRNCLVKASQAGGEPFTRGLGRPCAAPCRQGCHPVTRDDTTLPLWRAGNTLFFEMPRERVVAHLAQADRVVLHQRPSP